TIAHLLPCTFFSSSRRHTIFSRDWSSDVCSSDLNLPDHNEPQTQMETVLGLTPFEFAARYGPEDSVIPQRLQSQLPKQNLTFLEMQSVNVLNPEFLQEHGA